MILVPAPPAIHGSALNDELAAAGIPDADVVLVGGKLQINADETDRASVERIVAAHVPPLPPVPRDEFRAAVQAATSIAELKAALLGTETAVAKG